MNLNSNFDHSSAQDTHELRLAAHNSVRSLAESAQVLREQARHAADIVRDQASAAQQRTARYVADAPLKSVLLAAAAGALITGLALFFSSHRSR